MASIGPLSAPNAGVPPRPKRQPRKLDYLKCSLCRKAKVKCIPRHPADGKCTRCVHKNLACSGLHRKFGSVQHSQPPERPPIVSPTQSDTEIQENTHDALALISLYHILDMAIQELVVVGTEQLLCISCDDKSAREEHLRLLNYVVEDYREIMDSLEEAVKLIPHVSSSIITAFLCLNYIAHYTDRSTSTRNETSLANDYLSDGHYSMALVFQMRTLGYRKTHDQGDIDRLLRTRDDFISTSELVFERHKIPLAYDIGNAEKWELNFSETQCFLPRNLLQIPALAAAVQKDGRRDILGRLPSHILYDAKVNRKSGFDVRTNDCDVLGRSTLHIACSMTTQERQMRQLDLTSVRWPGCEMLGLNALHVAAARGDLEIFHTAATYEHDFFADTDVYTSDGTGRTYLHLAAYYGHLGLMEFLIDSLGHEEPVLYYIDNMDNTPLQFAARNGHDEIVKIILLHDETSNFPGMNSKFVQAIFFSAVIGGHLDTIKLLETHMDVDADEENENELNMVLTPLAEVARQGFQDCVEYFLEHEEVSINSFHKQKTPLDHAVDNEHDQCIELMRRHGARTFAELQDDGNRGDSAEDD